MKRKNEMKEWKERRKRKEGRKESICLQKVAAVKTNANRRKLVFLLFVFIYFAILKKYLFGDETRWDSQRYSIKVRTRVLVSSKTILHKQESLIANSITSFSLHPSFSLWPFFASAVQSCLLRIYISLTSVCPSMSDAASVRCKTEWVSKKCGTNFYNMLSFGTWVWLTNLSERGKLREDTKREIEREKIMGECE